MTMNISFRSLILIAALAVLTGCSTTHPVMDDYGQYLANNAGERKFEAVKAGDQYFLPEATQNHSYKFRSATVGYANVWLVEFGKILDATMQSKDVVDALGKVTKASTETQGAGNMIVFDLQKYSFENFGAHIVLTISVKNKQGDIFKKTYSADGTGQGGKMFWAGAFGMHNAIQQSTKLAMDEIISNFIRDLKAAPTGG